MIATSLSQQSSLSRVSASAAVTILAASAAAAAGAPRTLPTAFLPTFSSSFLLPPRLRQQHQASQIDRRSLRSFVSLEGAPPAAGAEAGVEMGKRKRKNSEALQTVCDLILSGECRSIVFLTGAGVSVSAGIPDFRSPGGMYDTLRPELLTASEEDRDLMRVDPTYVLSWALFSHNPLCYLELRRPFIVGIGQSKWKATLSHKFMKLCFQKHLLRRVYTQNIDGLDFQLCDSSSSSDGKEESQSQLSPQRLEPGGGGGHLPAHLIVPVHGSLGRASCEFCKEPYPMADFEHEVRTCVRDIYSRDGSSVIKSKAVVCKACHKAGVKPDTVLYGAQLPDAFEEGIRADFFGPAAAAAAAAGAAAAVSPTPAVAGRSVGTNGVKDAEDGVASSVAPAPVDLLIVMGTSLTVGPANQVVRMVPDSCKRLVINLEEVGHDLGIRYDDSTHVDFDVDIRGGRDFFYQGACDDGVRELADKLGWGEDLNRL